MTLDDYQTLAVSTSIYPDQGSIGGLVYTALKLNGEAGEVAEKVGKIVRDNNGIISPAQKLEMAKELGDVLWYVSTCGREIGYSLATIAKLNLEKLASRKKRNALSGSGDNR